MGLFSGMAKFGGRLLGSEKALDTIIESAASGLDKLAYTEEEKADDAKSERSEARKMVIAWLAATQGQNLSRRIISLSITFVWLGSYVLSGTLRTMAVFTNNEGTITATKLLEVSKLTTEVALDMNPAVMLILGFYYAAPYMGSVVGKAMEGVSKIGTRKPS